MSKTAYRLCWSRNSIRIRNDSSAGRRSHHCRQKQHESISQESNPSRLCSLKISQFGGMRGEGENVGPEEIVDPGASWRVNSPAKQPNRQETTLNSNQRCLKLIDAFRCGFHDAPWWIFSMMLDINRLQHSEKLSRKYVQADICPTTQTSFSHSIHLVELSFRNPCRFCRRLAKVQ